MSFQAQFGSPGETIGGAVSQTTRTIANSQLQVGDFTIDVADPIVWGAGIVVILLLFWAMKR